MAKASEYTRPAEPCFARSSAKACHPVALETGSLEGLSGDCVPRGPHQRGWGPSKKPGGRSVAAPSSPAEDRPVSTEEGAGGPEQRPLGRTPARGCLLLQPPHRHPGLCGAVRPPEQTETTGPGRAERQAPPSTFSEEEAPGDGSDGSRLRSARRTPAGRVRQLRTRRRSRPTPPSACLWQRFRSRLRPQTGLSQDGPAEGDFPTLPAHAAYREPGGEGHVCSCTLRSVQLSATPWTAAHQAPLSVGFSRPEYCSGLPSPPPGDLPNP